jgi:hypothetical protein
MKNEIERILCAAIWWIDYPIVTEVASARPANCETGIVFSGCRHHNCLHLQHAITGKASYEMGKSIQGFLTNKDRFVDRKEGLDIARAAGQINENELGNPRIGLFSEDLY